MSRSGLGQPARLGLTLMVAALLVGAWRLGVFARLSDPLSLAHEVGAMGAWGWLAFVAAYTALQPFGVPGTLFIVAAPLIWPWPVAFALSLTGTMAASVVGFSFARFLARDWVAKRVPPRLRRYEARLERSGFATVVLLRLLLWMPQPLHFFLGVSRVSSGAHFWGSLVGYTPPLLVVSYLGSEMFDTAGRMQPKAWPIMGGLLVVSLVIAWLARRWERRRATDEADFTTTERT